MIITKNETLYIYTNKMLKNSTKLNLFFLIINHYIIFLQ